MRRVRIDGTIGYGGGGDGNIKVSICFVYLYLCTPSAAALLLLHVHSASNLCAGCIYVFKYFKIIFFSNNRILFCSSRGTPMMNDPGDINIGHHHLQSLSGTQPLSSSSSYRFRVLNKQICCYVKYFLKELLNADCVCGCDIYMGKKDWMELCCSLSVSVYY
ncbi:hypothetical protein DFA_05767 [Cavenderia fasciculata]|uniref:Uncharacterized protein n=1 Tax=Cavenderia fasciculata TaxID=261658 RepID=F4PMI6_CACFS|nr:uncharacterized protein DFA_05767 [Cavenderia fasciculata]EGG23633.1 hypothetical protein DFA_05767 [Cavenderia fasciculata]|eukprot:XP_004361484.1 hypothetical protein DFA_05767 [Cavenderia fasciculata]